jgi:aminomethyltransferase
MKNTALNDIHISLGAKMVEFAGYNMPIQYDGVKAEHLSVRNSLGVFDVSHMGEFFISGEKSTEFLQSILSNDVSILVNDQAQYTCMPNDENGIVDDLILYKFNDEKYMLVVNASNIEKDLNWINSKNKYGVSIKDESDKYSLLAIQGPNAINAMQSLTNIDLNSIAFYLQVLMMLLFLLPDIQVAVVLKFTVKMTKPLKFGIKYLIKEQNIILNQLV